MRRSVGKELIQKGNLEREWAIILAQAQDDRALADYDVELAFSEKVARKRVEDAGRFLARIYSLLREADLKDTEITPPTEP